MSSTEPKQYGLILPNKNKAKVEGVATRKLNPLLDSDDELEQDEESPLNWVEASLKKSAGNSGQQSLQKRLLREALEEDASVFQYDEVYESMKTAKSSQQPVKDFSTKKPKYINNLMKHAEKRKLEGERRNERKVQREREAEGDEFADKESFVTSSYLKKMEELKKAEEEAKLEEMREERIDVMKHKNFGVFYNHLFRQRMGEPTVKEEPKSSDEAEETDKKHQNTKNNKRQKNYRTQQDLGESPEHQDQLTTRIQQYNSPTSSDSEVEEKVESYRERRDRYMENSRGKRDNKDKHQTSQERTRGRKESKESPKQGERYRRQRSHSSDKRRHSRSRSPPLQQLASEDRRSNMHSLSGTSDHLNKPIKQERLSPEKDSREKKENPSDRKDKKYKSRDGVPNEIDDTKVKKESEEDDKKKRLERIQTLFTKRTVGEKFNEALKRYYERKAEREARG